MTPLDSGWWTPLRISLVALALAILLAGVSCELSIDSTPTAGPSLRQMNQTKYAQLVRLRDEYQDYTRRLGAPPVAEELALREACLATARDYNTAAAEARMAFFLDKTLPHELDEGNCK